MDRGRISQTTKTAMRVKEAMIARRGCLDEGRMEGKSMIWAFSGEYAGMRKGQGAVGGRDDGRGNASGLRKVQGSYRARPPSCASVSGRAMTSTSSCTPPPQVCRVHNIEAKW